MRDVRQRPGLRPGLLAVLRAADEGNVWFTPPGMGGVLDVSDGTGRNVLAEAAVLRRAGLLEVDFNSERLGSYPYRTTAAGLAELRKAGYEDPARCGFCRHHADAHDYLRPGLDVPCKDCPGAVCPRPQDPQETNDE